MKRLVLRLLALLALMGATLFAVAGAGRLEPRDQGSVGGVPVGAESVRLALDLHGHVERLGAVRPARRRVAVSPDGRWQAVLQLPGSSGNTGTVAIGRRSPHAPLRVVERHLFAGTAAVSWSADSRWLAMTVWVPHLLSAVVVSTDGRRRVLAAPFCGDFQSGLAWEPGGARIALGVPRTGEGCGHGIDLRVRPVAGGRGTVIAREIAGLPLWSPDGRWLATSGGRAELMRPDGSRRRDLGGTLVSWSPQAPVLAVTDLQTQSLRVGFASGAVPTWDGRIDAAQPASFSPDGRLIAYRRWDGLVVRRVADRRIVARVPCDARDLSSPRGARCRATRCRPSFSRDGRAHRAPGSHARIVATRMPA